MADDDKPTDAPKITKDDITRRRSTGRRGFLAVAGVGAAAAAAGAALSVASDVGAQETPDAGGREENKSHCTDSDGGSTADRVGEGDRCRSCTDSDGGSTADRAGHGDRCGSGC